MYSTNTSDTFRVNFLKCFESTYPFVCVSDEFVDGVFCSISVSNSFGDTKILSPNSDDPVSNSG